MAKPYLGLPGPLVLLCPHAMSCLPLRSRGAEPVGVSTSERWCQLPHPWPPRYQYFNISLPAGVDLPRWGSSSRAGLGVITLRLPRAWAKAGWQLFAEQGNNGPFPTPIWNSSQWHGRKKALALVSGHLGQNLSPVTQWLCHPGHVPQPL